MRVRQANMFVALFALTALVVPAPIAAAEAAATATKKVVVIVGPTAISESTYVGMADNVAATATAAGATVVKLYCSDATAARVAQETVGANIIVYFGHGNGFPNPYTTPAYTYDAGQVYPASTNGWGLANGGSKCDDSNLRYYGESWITANVKPAPGFTMIYSNACYTPGAGEDEAGRPTDERMAWTRVGYYSREVLGMGAGAYFASDLWHGSSSLVDLVLRNPTMTYAQIAEAAPGYDGEAQRRSSHPDVDGARLWLQQTDDLGRMDYWYAFAGFPGRTPGEWGEFEPTPPTVTKVTPWDGQAGRSTSVKPAAWFDTTVSGVSTATFTLTDSFGFAVGASVRWRADIQKAILVPAKLLVQSEWYTVRLLDGIVGPSGAPLVPVEWQFRTKADGGDGSSATWDAGRPLSLGRGTHTGYQFDANGKMTGLLTATLPSAATLTTTTRRSVFTDGAIFSSSGTKVRSTRAALSSAWFMIQAICSGKSRGLSVW